MQPLLYSVSKKSWQRVGTNITYYRNHYHYNEIFESTDNIANGSDDGKGNESREIPVEHKGQQIKEKQTSKNFFTATFTVVFPLEGDTCYLSYHYPYTYSMLQVNPNEY